MLVLFVEPNVGSVTVVVIVLFTACIPCFYVTCACPCILGSLNIIICILPLECRRWDLWVGRDADTLTCIRTLTDSNG